MLPVARPTIALAAQAFRDEIVLLGFRLLGSAARTRRCRAGQGEVIAALDLYGQEGWLEKPEGFFAAPPPLTDVTIKTVTILGRTHERISFDSDYEPLLANRAGKGG